MKLKYNLDDCPGALEMFIYGLQWLVLTVPALIIIGRVLVGVEFTDMHDQIIYMQKMTFVTGVLTAAQVLWGHRMPLVIGPAAVLLVSILAGQSSSFDAIYTAIFVGGLILAILAFSGLFSFLQALFTPRVVAVILLLIAFTLTPSILDLVIARDTSASAVFNILFALIFTVGMFAADKYLQGVWKATMVVWAILIGSLAYNYIFSGAIYSVNVGESRFFSSFFDSISFNLSLDPGVLISFLLAFLALSINDLGSIQSLGSFLHAGDMKDRTRRGIGMTGLGNMLAGAFGVVGSVNYSMSPGVIGATGCASRYTLIPAGLGLVFMSFSPWIMGFIGNIPEVVIGSILIYLMSLQISAGLLLLIEEEALSSFNSGIIIGFPLVIATVTAFMPTDIVSTIPQVLRPIIGNGFVMGVASVILLEHLILPEKK